ncbi:MAG: C39 family peptidase [Eggerthella sp.]|nr:C39 family peptidase [Eggerthella sp.]MBS6778006.1 C39 family peptidase [Eggerthella sp.]
MALAAIVVLVIAFVVLLGNSNDSNVKADAYGNGSGVAQSTPRSEWRAGEVPYLYQIDPEWADGSYAGSTIAESGCGPTCLSMIYVYLTGRTNMDPADMAAFSESHNYVDSGMTSWAFMDEGARVLGLRSRELPADYQSVRKALDAGYPVIASVSKGDFTTQGHFIVLAGTDEDGKVIVHDPNSVERSAKVWDLDRILSQTRNLWAFSV